MSEEGREPDDLTAFCCQNPQCPDYGQRGRGNLTVPMRYGPPRRRLLRCKTCQSRFSERKGTPLEGAQLPEDKVVAVLQHIAEGVGVRKAGRLVGVNRNTVVRYGLLAGDHAQQLHDDLVAFSPQTREVQFDEKWSFVAKKEKHGDRSNPDDDNSGDCWDYVALDPEHRLVVSALVGRHSAEHVGLLVEDFHRRTEGRLMNLMTSDEDPAYAEAILATYGQEYQPRRQGKRGRRRAPRKRPPKGLK